MRFLLTPATNVTSPLCHIIQKKNPRSINLLPFAMATPSTICSPPDPSAPQLSESALETDKPLPAVTETAPKLEDAPTESHALAIQDHEEKGAAQIDHEELEVKDLGWDNDPEHIPTPLVGGLPNDELWVLVRRFNHVPCSL